jgi:hypothetical protein
MRWLRGEKIEPSGWSMARYSKTAAPSQYIPLFQVFTAANRSVYGATASFNPAYVVLPLRQSHSAC